MTDGDGSDEDQVCESSTLPAAEGEGWHITLNGLPWNPITGTGKLVIIAREVSSLLPAALRFREELAVESDETKSNEERERQGDGADVSGACHPGPAGPDGLYSRDSCSVDIGDAGFRQGGARRVDV